MRKTHHRWMSMVLALVVAFGGTARAATCACTSATRTDGDSVTWAGNYTLASGQYYWYIQAQWRLSPGGSWNGAWATGWNEAQQTCGGAQIEDDEVNVRGFLEYWDDADQDFHTASSNILTV
jgi:hypothetical protein